jgi:hypothetical protein
MRSRVCPVGLARASSIVFSDVPASEPVRPALANSASTPVVSSMDRPNWAATRPDWFRAMPMSCTEPWALPAAAASRSATCGTSLPCSLNWVSALAAISAASPTASWPAAARDSAPFSPPPRMSAVEMPAFDSWVMPSAAWVAEYWVSLPACSAAARSRAMSWVLACVAADTADICLSKSAADLTMPMNAAAPTTPSFSAESATLSSWPVFDALSIWPVKSFVAADARARPEM